MAAGTASLVHCMRSVPSLLPRFEAILRKRWNSTESKEEILEQGRETKDWDNGQTTGGRGKRLRCYGGARMSGGYGVGDLGTTVTGAGESGVREICVGAVKGGGDGGGGGDRDSKCQVEVHNVGTV